MPPPPTNSDEVAGLLSSRRWNGSPTSLMADLCASLLGQAGIEPPVDVRMLASFRNIAEIVETDQTESGRIWWDDAQGHLKVSVNAYEPEGRRRFTVCHEICHTLFPDFQNGTRSRLDRVVGTYGEGNDVEHLCDQGGAELLLPKAAFEKRLPWSPTIGDILEIASEFGAGPTATAVRAVDLSTEPLSFVILEPSLKPSEERRTDQTSFDGLEARPVPRYRVQKAYGNGMDLIPKHKSVSAEVEVALATSFGEAIHTDNLGLLTGSFEYSAEIVPLLSESKSIQRGLMLVRPGSQHRG